ncbi:TetR/AcrR family transcriptional regulator C-terminal domain-containing protein [Rhodococcus sp. SORGH_AS_0303]|uniref:TetR/AcrR family transcriptional regulator C-terminal domain-containing protein n=1 Tax=Rhodococcus sp. SORGH_AS_0303 TaxID=3041753 RepID=UPI00278455F8|nr:TetR/AcrR family transcriptional regulator C-terminal domain-containing protein [Rhodococcus sp. SORGH_AS_0303]MDQ1201969.1 TetR/AcrR family tetracycline transcriptional repressor [Rhodococcus sp. SORGH_AS_0303]
MQLRRDDVVDGALTILDDYGLADLTMRRLAGSLGVAPGALYWHVANKQALLGAVSDRILSRLDTVPAAVTSDVLDAVRGRAHGLRDALLAHRDGAEVVACSLAARTVTHPVRTTVVDDLRATGLTPEDAGHAADALLYYVLGATSDEQSRLQMESAGALAADRHLDDGDLDRDATARFDFGLELFVDGVRSRVRTLNE